MLNELSDFDFGVDITEPFTPEQASEMVKNAAASIAGKLPPEVVQTATLAGGALRALFDNTIAKDVDLFFENENDYRKAEHAMHGSDLIVAVQDSDTLHPSFITEDGLLTFNLVGFGFKDSPRELAESFDFRCIAMAVRLRDYERFIADGAVLDAVGKQLTIQNVESTRRLIVRAAHYVKDYRYDLTQQFMEKFPESVNVIGGEYSDYDGIT